MGTIVTFYSYKGGAGRTMALANIAVLLAHAGKKVLVADFDLEAPGLDRYLPEHPSDDHRDRPSGPYERGLLDLLETAISQPEIAYRDFTTSIEVRSGTLDVLPAGLRDERYNERVLGFNWRRFFTDSAGGVFIESLRAAWKEDYDFVFVDSRTGITDSGGICTIQLPDVLVPVITPNNQSVSGNRTVVTRVQKARQELAYDRPPLLVFPLPSRFDSTTEMTSTRAWLAVIAQEFGPMYADWLPKGFGPISILERTKLPHIPFYAFGERLAVLDDSVSDPASLGYAYRTAASLIGSDFRDVMQVLRPEGLGTGERDRLGGLVQQAMNWLDSVAPGRARSAWSLLVRLVRTGTDGTMAAAGLPVPMVSDDVTASVVRDLSRLALVEVRAGEVWLADAGLVGAWDELRERVLADHDRLDLLSEVRQAAQLQVPLTGEVLALALAERLRPSQSLLAAERRHIDFSLSVRARVLDRARQAQVSLLSILSQRGTARAATAFTLLFAVLGLAVTRLVDNLGGPVIGALVGAAIGIYTFVLALVVIRRKRATNVVTRWQSAVLDAEQFLNAVMAELAVRNIPARRVGDTVVYSQDGEEMALAEAELNRNVARQEESSTHGDPGPAQPPIMETTAVRPRMMAYVVPMRGETAMAVLEAPMEVSRAIAKGSDWRPERLDSDTLLEVFASKSEELA